MYHLKVSYRKCILINIYSVCVCVYMCVYVSECICNRNYVLNLNFPSSFYVFLYYIFIIK